MRRACSNLPSFFTRVVSKRDRILVQATNGSEIIVKKDALCRHSSVFHLFCLQECQRLYKRLEHGSNLGFRDGLSFDEGRVAG